MILAEVIRKATTVMPTPRIIPHLCKTSLSYPCLKKPTQSGREYRTKEQDTLGFKSLRGMMMDGLDCI